MSYKVYAGTQTAIDTWSEKVCIYDPGAEDDTKILLDPVLTREDSKAGSFEATVPLGNVAHSALQKLKAIVEVEQDGETLWQGRVMSHDMDFYLNQKIYCEGELAYLNDSSMAPYKYEWITISEFLGKVLDNHNSQTEGYKAFYRGTVDAGGYQQVLYATGCTVQSHRDEDDDGNVERWYTYHDQSGRILASIDANSSSLVDDPSSWKVGSTHYVGGKDYVWGQAQDAATAITKTSDTLYTVSTGVVYSERSQKTYVANIKVVTSGSTKRAMFEPTDTESDTYTVNVADDGSVTVTIKNVVTGATTTTTGVGYVLIKEYNLYTFGDGKNFGVTWDILQSELTDTYGGHFIVRREKHPYWINGETHYITLRHLDYVSNVTEKTGQKIEFGENLLDLDSYVKAENVVTRVIAVGYRTSGFWVWKKTKTLTATANDYDAQKYYGLITRVIVIEGTSSTTETLLKAAQKEIAKNLRYLDGMTISAVDLKDAGVDTERLRFMKNADIISEPHGVHTSLTCTKLVEPLDKPDEKKFTFGIDFSSISDLQALSARKATNAFDMAHSAVMSFNDSTPASLILDEEEDLK